MTTFIGKCGVKGCKTRVRVDIPTLDIPFTNHPTTHPRLAPVAHREGAESYGLVCHEHGTWVKVRALNGTVVAEKTCDGRCTSATGPNCECSCGGHNHGRSFLVSATA